MGDTGGLFLRFDIAHRRYYISGMFTAVYRKSGKWWAAYVEEVPGVNTQGATLTEARANLKEALAMILETNRELAREQERDPGRSEKCQ
jgi:predicted RNase H-like HicB family nuclease